LIITKTFKLQVHQNPAIYYIYNIGRTQLKLHSMAPKKKKKKKLIHSYIWYISPWI